MPLLSNIVITHKLLLVIFPLSLPLTLAIAVKREILYSLKFTEQQLHFYIFNMEKYVFFVLFLELVDYLLITLISFLCKYTHINIKLKVIG